MANLGVFPCVTSMLPAMAVSLVVVNTSGSLKTTSVELGRTVRRINLQGVTDAGSFIGSVQEAGAPVPNCVVRCYERVSGQLIAEVRTRTDGTFTIPGVQRGSDQHYAIALDPDGGAVYNGLIFDRIIPV